MSGTDDPTRYHPPTYEQWIETHGLDYGDSDTPYPASRSAARRARKEMTK